MTNSEVIGGRLLRSCDGKHRHIHLPGGSKKETQSYPVELCHALQQGIREQLKIDDEGVAKKRQRAKQQSLAKIRKVTGGQTRGKGDGGAKELSSLMHEGQYWDDVKSGWLPNDLVEAARKEELKYIRQHGVYEKVPRDEAWRVTSKPPIRTRWVDTN